MELQLRKGSKVMFPYGVRLTPKGKFTQGYVICSVVSINNREQTVKVKRPASAGKLIIHVGNIVEVSQY